MRRTLPARFVPVILGGILLGYFFLPVFTFISRAGTENMIAGFSSPEAQTAIRNSLITAPIATVIATVCGVPLAYILARRDFVGKRLIEALVILPLIVPPVVGGVMILTAVGRFTPIGSAAAALGIPLTDSLIGVILAQTFVSAPFVIITARAGFGAIDIRLEQAARSLGHSPLHTFRSVSIPLASGAILAGVLLTFVRAIGEFGAVMMVAYNPRTMPTRIWVDFITGGIDGVVPLAVLLLVIALVGVALIQRVGQIPTVIDR